MERSEAGRDEIRQLRAEVSDLRSKTLQLVEKIDQEREVSRRRGRFESFLSLVLLGRGLERASLHLFDAMNSYRREKRSDVPASEAARFIVALLRMALGSGIRSAVVGATLGFLGGLLVALPAWYLQRESNRLLEEQSNRQTGQAVVARREQLRDIIYSEATNIDVDGKCLPPNKVLKRQEALIDFVRIERDKNEQIYLRNADLRCLNLYKIDLSGVILVDADLRSSNLTKADLRGADLNGVKLDRARLHKADFSDSVGLDEQALQNARGRGSANLPEFLARE